LISRYGDKHWLVEIEQNVYAVREARYLRFGGADGRDLAFLDFDGGPFLVPGTVLESTDGDNLQIERIVLMPMTGDQFGVRVHMKALDDSESDG
jgi:hypothetical protein